FEYADRMFVLLAVIKAITQKGFRFIEGFSFLLFDEVPDHNTIWRRVGKVDPDVVKKASTAKKSKTIDIILDATGISVNGTNVWIDEKYNLHRKRNWVKLHLCVDAKTKEIISVNVLDKNTHEGEQKEFRKIVSSAQKKAKVKKAYADGAYDSKKNFDFCKAEGIEPVIKIRRNSVNPVHKKKMRNEDLKYHGKAPPPLSFRDEQVIEQAFWKSFVMKKKYGKRSGIEGVIGSFKRFFGEYVSSKIRKRIENELIIRCNVWNLMIA
ncbi:MAG: IS5 family transposase, partial [Candidatus Aenigmarchaeota archaeon]|nr:IS5 family transposase [Candidatus Aenigmarchaeota archaeon]